MCGIVGYVGFRDAQPIVISGLEKLEYRGYDSAGIAMFEQGKICITRARGKLLALKERLSQQPRNGTSSIGLGHTRWATHGKPSEENAHPHNAGRVSLIHNGIVENYVELRANLIASGAKLLSETDTEIAAHLFNQELRPGVASIDAFKATCRQLKGSYALLAIDSDSPDQILVAKTATPIIIGVGEGENIIASDIPAVLEHTRRVIILEDGDTALVKADSITIWNGGVAVERPIKQITWDPITAQKGGYKHYMLKEIHEQSVAISDTLLGRIDQAAGLIKLPDLEPIRESLCSANRMVLLGCGTAWHACLMTKFFIEQLVGIPCEVDYASEFRYRPVVVDKSTVVLAISQSGETADTVAALELAKQRAPTMAICNVLDSSLTRKVSATLYTHAGPEISVASTKAFSTQLVGSFLLALYIGQERGVLSPDQVRTHVQQLVKLPALIDETLKAATLVEKIARRHSAAKDFLFLGRGPCYPIALEGALKLKEISYIHAEGYPSGEIKHGPIALIDESLPVVVLVQDHPELFDKSLSNLREVESRGARIIVVTDKPDHPELRALSTEIIEIPASSHLLAPLLMTIPLQLLAYYVAVQNGTDVDLPRNLAKSVTVE